MWLFKKKSEPKSSVLDDLMASVPKDWMVWKMGQEPGFMTWNCILFRWEGDPADKNRAVSCEDCDSPQEALSCCISRVKGGKGTCKYKECHDEDK